MIKEGTPNQKLNLGELLPWREIKKTPKWVSMTDEKNIKKLEAERDALVAKLQTQAQELQRLNQMKDNFLSVASHELRTPLSVIRGYTDFLLSENFGTLNEQQAIFLQKIMHNVDQLTELINNMLDLSKLKAGKMPLTLTKTALHSLIQNTIDDHRILFREKSQTLKFECAPDCHPHVKTDTEKLKIVLANLISNAYKFTPAQGHISVILKEHDPNYWLISVIDTGIGIPDDQKSIVFEKFTQLETDLQAEHPGSGLGLSIVREIIEHLGGKIWVEDNTKAQSGSVFRFTLPK